MDVIQFIPQFLYRIRYRLLWGSLIVTALVIYFTQFLPFSYTVNSNIYAGVTNASSVTEERSDYFSINSTFDNIINIGKSKGTLEKVSVRLLATCLVHGNEGKDTPYILAKHYRQLLQITPKEVLTLVDRQSVDKTTENLRKYRQPHKGNFVFSIFSQPSNPFFSFKALNKIIIRRLGNSDLIDINYTCSDPGIAQNTIAILEEELTEAYEILRFSSTRNVIAYFEEQVKKAKSALTKEEDDLMRYNVQEEVINYGEQTKALAITKYEVDDRYELARRQYESARSLLDMLEKKMDVRARLIRTNTDLLQELDKVSKLNEKITEQEIFTADTQHSTNEELTRSKRELKQAEDNISHLSDNINEYAFSKEGVGIQNMVNEWLLAVINEAKAQAELKVLEDRRKDIREGYKTLSPVGTQVNRKERAVGLAEDTYREVLRGLSEARLRLKNIEMSTSNLQIITPPEYPLTDNGRKRLLYIIAAFAGSVIFIIGFSLLVELIDRTLRDADRSRRLTGLPVIAAFNGISNLKFRGFLKACNRRAAAYVCQQLNQYLKPGQSIVINLLSMEEREGKSFLSRYFADYWKTEGLKVRIVSYHIDFEVDKKEYIQAQQLSDFWQKNDAEETPDIILVEYPALCHFTVPESVIAGANVNLLIANAVRLWSAKDDARMQSLRKVLAEKPFFLYLNNADREVVESFTGPLPPYNSLHSFLSNLAQLGLTYQKAAVK